MKLLPLFLLLLPFEGFSQVNLSSSNLPIVVINTNGQSIPEETKITAQMQVFYKGPGQRNALTDPPAGYNGPIGIERRGSSSDFFSDKKPYSIETRDAAGEDLDFPLLDMPKEADWAFIAPYSDKTLVRDAFIYELGRQIMPWAPRTQFVELLLDGRYEGVYMVTEKIKRGKNRVDISKLKPTDTAGDSLTGGYILKIDKTEGTQEVSWTSAYPPFAGGWQYTLWQLEYPKLANIKPQQGAYISGWINQFESAMYGSDFADTSKGFYKYLDLPSFVDYILLNELSKNVDAYRLSTYFYKDRDDKDPLLHAGPIWDYNIAFGNVNYCGGDNTAGWAINFNGICGDDNWVIQFWWQKLWQNQPFRKLLRDRWYELRKGPLSDIQVLHTLDSLTNLLKESQARNFQRWPILNNYVWPNAFCCGSYDQHVAYMRNWVLMRLDWMDANVKGLYVGEYFYEKKFVSRVEPNPVAAGSELRFRMYLRYSDLVRVRVYDATGHFMAELKYDPELNGENELAWNHPLRPGVYFYDLLVNDKRESSGRFVVAK